MIDPAPRGPLSGYILARLRDRPYEDVSLEGDLDPLAGDDFHLALYVCYEMHYRGVAGVDADKEWEPWAVAFRRDLERRFEDALRAAVEVTQVDGDAADRLKAILESDRAPSLSRYIETDATLEQIQEFVIHRSAYQLKEADPHSLAIPRLTGRAKAAYVEIQADEYGGGDPRRIHAVMFGDSMEALGLDPTYGAYIDAIPGYTLATVNLMSMFGLNRRLLGAAVGHLSAFEMTSPVPNGRYARGLRRVGAAAATAFFDEHVEADSVHEAIASHDLAGSFVADRPAQADDVFFGAQALVHLEATFAERLLQAWAAGRSSLRVQPVPA